MAGADDRDAQQPRVNVSVIGNSSVHGGVNIINGDATVIGGNQVTNNVPAVENHPQFYNAQKMHIAADRQNLPPFQGVVQNVPKTLQREPSQSDDRPTYQIPPNEEKMKVLVENVAKCFQEPPEFLYNMGNKGRVIVFNNTEFDHFNERVGSEKDVKLLRDFFSHTLSWDFHVYPTMNVAEMKEKLNDIRQYDFSQNGAFFLIILSHGNQYGICGRDSKHDDYRNILNTENDIIPLFTNTKCPTLSEKPKVFIMQACRGDIDDKGYCVEDTDAAQVSPPVKYTRHIPDASEFLLCYPCSPGYTSVRNHEYGSVFINALITIFRAQYKMEDISRMLLRVNYNIARDRNGLRIKQMPSHDNRLTRLTFFEEFFLEKKKMLVERGIMQ